MAKKELFTSGKLAKEWSVPPKVVKETIEKAGVTPDVKKGACNYFTVETVAKIKSKLEKEVFLFT